MFKPIDGIIVVVKRSIIRKTVKKPVGKYYSNQIRKTVHHQYDTQ
jgi:hypothetical protein